jgi:hypothetical protein
VTDLARSILEHFAVAFPESAHYRGGRKLRLGKWAERFPRIERDVEAKEEFLDSVDELVSLGLVTAGWARFREGTDLDAIYLEDPDRMYELLGRASPEEVRIGMLEMLESDGWTRACAGESRTGEIARAIREHLNAELEARHPVGLGTVASVRDLALLLSAPADLAATLPIRALSVRLFNDSKRLERLLEEADRVCAKAAGVALSQTLGLERSYPEATFSLRGVLCLEAAADRRWELRGEPVILPLPTVAAVSRFDFHPSDSPPLILSVENKETFHVLAAVLAKESGSGNSPGRLPWAGIVYTAGHPNAAVVMLLHKLHEAGAALHHFGDLDPDGLFILTEIADAVGAEVTPECMSLPIYRRYRPYGYALSPAAVARLTTAGERLPPSLRLLADEIVAEGFGVEQEVIAEW